MFYNDGFLKSMLKKYGFEMVIDGEMVEKWELDREDGSKVYVERFNRNNKKKCSFLVWVRSSDGCGVDFQQWFPEEKEFKEWILSK